MPTPAEAAKYFFQGAMHMWTSAPDFKGVESSMSLDEWFSASLREHLPVIARKRGAHLFIAQLSSKVEEAFKHFNEERPEDGRKSMLELLNLIQMHLHLPSKPTVDQLALRAKGLH